jgi:DNA-binding CsgD family transcriptional regulator
MSDTGDDRTRFLTFGDNAIDGVAVPQRAEAAGNAGPALAEIARTLTLAPDSVTRQALMRTAIRNAGFDWLCYCRVLRIGEFVSRCVWFDTYSPPGWPQRYEGERFFEIDPRVGFACRFEWPRAWDLDSMFSPAMPPRCEAVARRFTATMRQFGLESGVSFGLSTGHPLEHCIITLSSAHAGRSWIADTALGEAYAVGVGLHAFLDARATHVLPALAGERLSDVQRAILRFVTQGFSDKEMAEQLEMSAHNVGYHLRQLKKIYNAQNRVQLAYIAGRLLGD